MKKLFLWPVAFIACFSACKIGEQVKTEPSPALKKISGTAVALNTSGIRSMRQPDDKTPQSFEVNEPCLIDGTFFDECPVDIDNLGGGNGTGGGGGSQNTPPDFNPLSGSIEVTNPAVLGQDFQFHVVIENKGGNFFPPGSLQNAPGVGFDGVFVHFHILKPGNAQPNASNLVFEGIFDPEHVDDGSSYLIAGHFNLSAAMVTPGANHQFVVVVDPENFVPELNESNNTSFDTEILQVVTDQPDFLPLTGNNNIRLQPNPVAVGESLLVGCKVQNKGAPFKDGSVVVKYTAALVGGDELANPIVLGTASRFFSATNALNTNATTPVISKSIVVNLAPGQYKISATVDPNNGVTETSGTGEGNNTALLGTITVLAALPGPLKPDLVFEAFGVPPRRPPFITPFAKNLNTKVFLKNNGGPITDTFVVRLEVQNQEAIASKDLLKIIRIPGMFAGEIRLLDVTTNIFTPAGGFGAEFFPLTQGMHQVIWSVDRRNVIAETNEHNNVLVIRRAFILQAQDLDLLDSLGVEARLDSTFAAVRTVFKVKCTNRGHAKISDYVCEFNVVTGATILRTFVFTSKEGTSVHLPIAPGEVVTIEFAVGGDFITGPIPYKLHYELDYTRELLEVFVPDPVDGSGEDNNEGNLEIP